MLNKKRNRKNKNNILSNEKENNGDEDNKDIDSDKSPKKTKNYSKSQKANPIPLVINSILSTYACQKQK